MDAHACCILVEQARNHIDFVLDRLEWRQRLTEFERATVVFGPPMLGVHYSTSHKQRGESFGDW